MFLDPNTLHNKDWVGRLLEALWAYRTTWKMTTRLTPYDLIYRNRVFLPIKFEIKTICIALYLRMNLSDAQK